jgi:hypothetical protein
MKTLAIVVGTGRSRDPSGESQNQSQRLATQAQHLLERLATATGRLAGNKSACDRTRESVRGDLAQLDASLTTLSRQAACNLPPSSLARAAITGVAQAVERATGELQQGRARSRPAAGTSQGIDRDAITGFGRRADRREPVRRGRSQAR